MKSLLSKCCRVGVNAGLNTFTGKPFWVCCKCNKKCGVIKAKMKRTGWESIEERL